MSPIPFFSVTGGSQICGACCCRLLALKPAIVRVYGPQPALIAIQSRNGSTGRMGFTPRRRRRGQRHDRRRPCIRTPGWRGRA